MAVGGDVGRGQGRGGEVVEGRSAFGVNEGVCAELMGCLGGDAMGLMGGDEMVRR
jgi:hypothetical protein